MAKKAAKKDASRLHELIEEATVDCYNESEAHQGFMVMIEENVVCPFKAKVIGEEVEVVELGSPERGLGCAAVCHYKGKDYNIDVNSLEWPKKNRRGSSGSRRIRPGSRMLAEGGKKKKKGTQLLCRKPSV
jgi:Calcium binding